MIPAVRRGSRILTVAAFLAMPSVPHAHAQELQRGVIIDEVNCANDQAQTYALYLPSTYSAERTWPLLIAFHPAARGRAMVEKYQAAAEQYGWIIAGSNTSRNGPWAVSMAAVQAMWPDLGHRVSIDAERVYLTGMSGGARVAMRMALGNNHIAGVIASSAGYPDSEPRATVPFAVFGTTGTEDFNYIEMRQLDRKLSSPHYLAIFDGGHTLPPDSVALEAIEWMELQAMKSGRRQKDEAVIDRLLAKRRQLLAASTSPPDTVHLLDALVADFNALRDVSADEKRAKDLSKQSEVKKALKRERAADDAEERVLAEIFDLEAGLNDENRRLESLSMLRDRLSKLAQKANADGDSPERRQARRVLRAITMGAAGRVQNAEYLKLLEQYTPPGGPFGGI